MQQYRMSILSVKGQIKHGQARHGVRRERGEVQTILTFCTSDGVYGAVTAKDEKFEDCVEASTSVFDCEDICEVIVPIREELWWTTKAPVDMPEDFRGVQDWHRPRVIEDSMKINGCLSSVARDEPVAIHVSCCTHQFEFEVDRSLIAEPSPKHGNIMRTILQTGRRSTSHMKPSKNSKTLANI